MNSISSNPQHIAIIMDGNGRWAKKRFLPRVAGHRAGVEAVRKTVQACIEKKIPVLTLFAFGSENWRRPQEEVSFLMELFLTTLEREIKVLHEQNIQLRFIGDESSFNPKLRAQIEQAKKMTAANTGLKVIMAVNYSGHWDICQAVRSLQQEEANATVTPELIRRHLVLSDLPEPDLFIRTSGEQRLSNFMLWQLAYTELYFTPVLWPDFDAAELEKALDFFATRERRFGRTSEQLQMDDYA